MGTMYTARCETCSLSAEDLFSGRAMTPSLFQPSPAWCPYCEALVTTEVVTPIRELNELREEADQLFKDDLAPDGASAIALAIRLRQRPRCPTCDHRVHRLRLDPPRTVNSSTASWSQRCPRCKENTLRVGISGHFD